MKIFLKFVVTKEHRKLKKAVSSKIFSFVRFGEFKLLSKIKTKFNEV